MAQVVSDAKFKFKDGSLAGYERLAAQHFFDSGMCLFSLYSTWYSLPVAIADQLTPEALELKEKLTEEGFLDWSRRDLQQFIRGLEAHGWYVYMNLVLFVLQSLLNRNVDHETLSEEIQEKTAAEIEKFYKVFKKEWKTLAGMCVTASQYSLLTFSTEASRIEAPISEGEAKRS